MLLPVNEGLNPARIFTEKPATAVYDDADCVKKFKNIRKRKNMVF